MSRKIAQTPATVEEWGPDADRRLLLEMGLRMTPAERFRWLTETVEELLPWVGRAALS